jgi:hypothetical protein
VTTALPAPAGFVWVLYYNPSVRHGGVSPYLEIIGPAGFASPSWVDFAVGLIPAGLPNKH